MTYRNLWDGLVPWVDEAVTQKYSEDALNYVLGIYHKRYKKYKNKNNKNKNLGIGIKSSKINAISVSTYWYEIKGLSL